MCTGFEPYALALLGVGTGMSVVGNIAQGAAEGAMYETQAAIERERGGYEATEARKGAHELRARQRVAIAKSGVLPEGSPLTVMEESARNAELDAMAVQWGTETSDEMLKRSARYARRASYWRAGSSLLGGAADYARLGQMFVPRAPSVPSPGT